MNVASMVKNKYTNLGKYIVMEEEEEDSKDEEFLPQKYDGVFDEYSEDEEDHNLQDSFEEDLGLGGGCFDDEEEGEKHEENEEKIGR